MIKWLYLYHPNCFLNWTEDQHDDLFAAWKCPSCREEKHILEVRPPMQKVRVKHSPPIGKNCQAAWSGQQLTGKSSRAAYPVNHLSQVNSPDDDIPPQSRVTPEGPSVASPPMGPSGKTMTVQENMEMATIVSTMDFTMKSMQRELDDMQAEKVNSCWQHIQDMDASN